MDWNGYSAAEANRSQKYWVLVQIFSASAGNSDSTTATRSVKPCASFNLCHNLLNPGFIKEDIVHELFEIATQQEIEWTDYILGNHITGMDKKNTEKYTKYLANKRIMDLGFNPLYPGYTENPYAHFELMSDDGGEDVKSNFFEATVTNYSQSNAVEGWDEI